ncbi:MAG: 50S ribosomal protein L5 [Nanoarchaeota archaeon]
MAVKKQKVEKKTEKKKKDRFDEIKIEKLVLSVGGTAEKLEKGISLLQVISGMKPVRIQSTRRIPSLGVRPGLETGAKVTLRKAKIKPLLSRLLKAVSNEVKESSFEDNHFSFGIKEYIEIPDMEYQRDIGILGLNVTIDFVKPGKRVKRKKIKRGKIPKRQKVSREEIKQYMIKHYDINLLEKEHHEN